MVPIVDTDVLVIGGGGAGARAALSAAESGVRVMLALKGLLGSSGATAYRVSSVGGFQAATGLADPDDTPEEHFKDIVNAAQGMCSERLARVVASEAPRVLHDLAARGVELDTAVWSPRPDREWHSGQIETSLVLAVRSALVRRALARRLPPAWVDVKRGLAMGRTTFRKMNPKGRRYFGWPAAARAETSRAALTLRGQLILQNLISELQSWHSARRANRYARG
jgi:FAD binding domain